MKFCKGTKYPVAEGGLSSISIKEDKYDEANAFLLLPKSNEQKIIKKDKMSKIKMQSKTKIKKLKKLHDQKTKRNKRIETLHSLKDSTISFEERTQMKSISYLQTYGKKKSFNTQIKSPWQKEDCEECIDESFDPPEDILNINSKNNVNHLDNMLNDSYLESHNSKSPKTLVDQEDKTLAHQEDREIVLAKVDIKTNANGVKGIKRQKIEVDTTKLLKKVVPVLRDPKIQKLRDKLPIISEEHSIMESINENPFVIICGETGSGKTTQVPQFLYEAGYALERRICVTEPRRVAATTLSKRVGLELGLGPDEVSYQIRYDGTVSPSTKIKFVTDGVLMREVQNDFLLTDYSAIIIDEAHERSVYTDVLIGLLSRIIPVREKRGAPLKLIIMSATMRIDDFAKNKRLFKCDVPIIKIPSKQYPISIHFSLSTPLDNYMEELYRKVIVISSHKTWNLWPGLYYLLSSPHVKRFQEIVCKIHRKLPSGGILVFVTGRAEVNELCKKLKETFPSTNHHNAGAKNSDKSRGRTKKLKSESHEVSRPNDLNSYPTSATENPQDYEEVEDCTQEPLHVLPLYSLLAPEHQNLVFEYYACRSTSDACAPRLCVVATNVAETSVTIPGIKYVVDCGREKRLSYGVSAIPRLSVVWISKSSADQRAGRSGRTGPGHCYRLYSSAVYNDEFPQFSSPEIETRPVEDIVLQMKLLNIDKVENFPFPSPPPLKAIRGAELLLAVLGLMEPLKTTPKSDGHPGPDCQLEDLVVKGSLYDYVKRYNSPGEMDADAPTFVLTELGKGVAGYPLNPRYGKMLHLLTTQPNQTLLTANQHVTCFGPDLLPYATAIIAGISVRELFLGCDETLYSPQGTPLPGLERARIVAKAWASSNSIRPGPCPLGDLMVLLRAIGGSDYAAKSQSGQQEGSIDLESFCSKYGLRQKAIVEIGKIRAQLHSSLSRNPNSHQSSHLLDDEEEERHASLSAVASNNNPLMPPNDQQINALRRLVLAGAGFNIAKRIDPQPQEGVEGACTKAVAGKMSKRPYYQCLYDVLPETLSDAPSNADPIRAYIHPSSVLADQHALPEYIVYQDSYLVLPRAAPSSQASESSATKIYLRTVTDVEPKWFPLYYPSLCRYDVSALSTGATLVEDTTILLCEYKYFGRYTDSKSPGAPSTGKASSSLRSFYDARSGSVQCRAPCSFGPHDWPIAPVPIEFPHSLEKFKLFATYFLEGKVFPALQKYANQLLLTPSTMTKSWAKLQSKTQSLLKALIKHDVCSRPALTRIWADKNPNYLLKEYLEWLPESLHGQVAPLWPLDRKQRCK